MPSPLNSPLKCNLQLQVKRGVLKMNSPLLPYENLVKGYKKDFYKDV